MPEAVIVATARSPIGRAFKGSLKDLRSDDLTARMVQAAMAKVPQLDPSQIDDLLLGCGLEDKVPYNDICPATQATAPHMAATPGKALFLGETGHSLDNERRSFWAQQIVQFLGL